MAADLEYIKSMLGITEDNAEKITLINKMIERATNRLKSLLPIDPETQKRYDVPTSLDWIIEEIVIHRFNRIGSEGMTSETVAGHSVSFSDTDFKNYWGYIESEFPELQSNSKGKVTFYI